MVNLGWVYQSTISKRPDGQWLRFQEIGGGGGGGSVATTPFLGQICQPKWLDHRRVKRGFRPVISNVKI